MKCFHCQAELHRGTATFSDSRKGYVLVLQDLPAWVCPQCGEGPLRCKSFGGDEGPEIAYRIERFGK